MIDTKGMTPQCASVVMYMVQYGSITGRDAAHKLGIAYLPTRIQDLKKKYGVSIKTEYEPNNNNGGYHARYSIFEAAHE